MVLYKIINIEKNKDLLEKMSYRDYLSEVEEYVRLYGDFGRFSANFHSRIQPLFFKQYGIEHI